MACTTSINPATRSSVHTSVAVEGFAATTPLVHLSELLAGQAGVVAQDRGNYAQDLQIAVRGFGVRSTFGVRGVRGLVDGIPASMPDGQGQAATAHLPSAALVEVLRGPLAQLYGNAAGGVVQVTTRDLFEMPFFQTLHVPAAEPLIVDQATVSDLLERIRAMQAPEQAEIRARNASRERAHGRIHAHIMSLAA